MRSQGAESGGEVRGGVRGRSHRVAGPEDGSKVRQADSGAEPGGGSRG